MDEKILVLEDEPTILNNLVELLEAENYKVFSGLNGAEGVALLKQNKPDLILCDIMMPNIDGIEFYQIVKNSYETRFIPFIFLTAKTDLVSIRAGLNLGADDYITKPFMAEDLLNAIRTRLKKVNDYNAQYDSLIKNISMYIPHELRTPLVAIMGYSQLIISDVESMEKNEIKEMMERILWSAHRLHSRIEKFIAYSDLDLAWSQIETNPNNLVSCIENDLVANIILGHYFLNKRAPFIKLQIEPENIKVPKVQLVYLLKELLENAVKYSEMESEIIVLGEKQPAGYCITVKDCGIGMDKKEIDNIGIFKQFSRDIYSQDGNGLGLAICKKIVQMNNGQISFESEKGKSTTVKVTLTI